MEYLVVTPPVITPSEPPSGAFLLAAGLRARGYDAGFLDLSLAFFRHVFSRAPSGRGYPDTLSAMDYLTGKVTYSPQQHRTASGNLSTALKNYSREFPGWRITLMDAQPPGDLHRPTSIYESCRLGRTPFSEFWEEYLVPLLEDLRPNRVLVSLAYLSQLAAGIDLVLLLRRLGLDATVGGSLLNSLSRTGQGLDLVRAVVPESVVSDGSVFPGFSSEGPLLGDLAWPNMLEEWNYIAGRPVIPFALSTGCYWNRCLFCPDSGRRLNTAGISALEGFLDSVPDQIMEKRPIIHFLDSAVPEKPLLDSLPALSSRGLDFYTFARPEPWLLSRTDMLSENGCLMLQLGVESGSRNILERFCKGIDPEISLEVIRSCASSGIRTYVYMLLGLPGETDRDTELTMELLEEAGDSVDFINFSIFNLPENCELTERAVEFGIEILDDEIPEDSIRLYRPFLCEGSNPRLQARELISRVFPGTGSVSEALKRTPNWFRTSHFPMIEIEGRRN